MITTGKKARKKIGGTRYTLKRMSRSKKAGHKEFSDWVMTREQYRAMKKAEGR